jgi:sterol desaturase/sphingolipid hydroxylase (fatty acid hydroxylase superfamily)
MMTTALLEREPIIRLVLFLGILVIMAIWETLAPRRPLTTSKRARWFNNLAIVLIDTVGVRLIFSGAALGMAFFVERHKWGLLNNVALPDWFAIVAGVISLDFAVYLQHVIFHAVPAFWRLHMMHHSDLDFDVTTGIRFHPIEILLSMGIKMSVVLVLGISALTVLIFEILLNTTSLFNHGNVRLSGCIDRLLRLIVVTPEMHRVHHSVVIRETNSNFGFNLPWWDRLFGTYRNQPAVGHQGMTIGLSQFRDPKRLTLPWLLALPFIGNPGNYSFWSGTKIGI